MTNEKKIYNIDISGLYYKNIMMILSYDCDTCTINVSLVFALALASVVNYAHK